MKARIAFCLTCLFVVSTLLALGGSAHAQDEDTVLFGVAWSPDGKWISAASTNGLWLYDTEFVERAPKQYFAGDVIPVAVFNPVRNRLAAYDQTTRLLHIIEPDTGDLIVDIPGAVDEYDFAYDLRYSIDGKLLAIGFDTSFKIYDGITSRERQVFDSTGVFSIVPAADKFVTGGFRGYISTYDVTQTDFPVSSFEPDDLTSFESIYQVAMLPNTDEGLAIRGDGLIRFNQADETSSLFDPTTTEGVRGFAVNHAGNLLVVGMDGKLVFYDLSQTSPAIIREMPTAEDATVFSLAFSPDDTQLVTLDTSGHIHLLEADTGHIFVEWNGFTRAYSQKWG